MLNSLFSVLFLIEEYTITNGVFKCTKGVVTITFVKVCTFDANSVERDSVIHHSTPYQRALDREDPVEPKPLQRTTSHRDAHEVEYTARRTNCNPHEGGLQSLPVEDIS
jgi:hypothetical protein